MHLIHVSPLQPRENLPAGDSRGIPGGIEDRPSTKLSLLVKRETSKKHT